MQHSTNAAEVVASMATADLVRLDTALERPCRAIPNLYRVCDDRYWQCEWDDLTEIGAFRSLWMWRCVRRAQRARVKWLREAIQRRRAADDLTREAQRLGLYDDELVAPGVGVEPTAPP
jgi:hypothetical protein